MSKIITFCNEIKTRLNGLSEFAGIPVILDRQQEVASDIAKALGKMQAVIVLYPMPTKRVADPQVSDHFLMTVEIEVHTLPITSTAAACDDIAEDVARALDSWMRPSAPSAANDDRVVVRLLTPVPDPDYLVWRVVVSARTFL